MISLGALFRGLPLGCFRDTAERTIPSLEGTHPILDGYFRSRENAVTKCYMADLNLGYKVFAVQNGGQCMGSPTAEMTYNRYGESAACLDCSNCWEDVDCQANCGKGGWYANSVYQILRGEM